jgi:hypothetical protein
MEHIASDDSANLPALKPAEPVLDGETPLFKTLERSVSRGWAPWLRGAVSIFSLMIGAFVVEAHSYLAAAVAILGYIVFYVMFENFLMGATAASQRKFVTNTIADMEFYWMAEQRLSLRLGTIT